MHQILVIDDDANTLTLMQDVLTTYGFRVLTAPGAIPGLRSAYEHRPDAIILDLMMPEMDGFEVCSRLREMTDKPILLLTGREPSTENIVRGFESGADDYISKPFKTPELISRLKTRLRRVSARSRDDSQYLFPAPSVVLDCGRHEFIVEGQTIYLSPGEFEVLRLLVRHAGRTLSHNAILSQVWGPERIGDGRLVKQYIYQLRQKIEPDPAEPKYIHTIRGEGYYFAPAEPE